MMEMLSDDQAFPPTIVSGPRVSVIIVFYNHEGFVREAIDSILDQRRDGVEVIAVDNGSTDGTRERLLQYGDEISTILWDTNQKASDARNAGAFEAVGDYLAFLDGDDAFVPWTIAVYDALIQARKPIVVVGEMSWFEGPIPDPGPPPTVIRYHEYHDYFAKDRPVGASASAMICERQAFDRVGGWDQSPTEDFDLLWKLGTSGPFIQVVEPSTSLHRSHSGQTSRKRSMILESISNLIRKEKSGGYPGGQSRRRERRACVGGVVIHWTRLTLASGSRIEALRFLLANSSYVVTAILTRGRSLLSGRRALETIEMPAATQESGLRRA